MPSHLRIVPVMARSVRPLPAAAALLPVMLLVGCDALHRYESPSAVPQPMPAPVQSQPAPAVEPSPPARPAPVPTRKPPAPVFPAPEAPPEPGAVPRVIGLNRLGLIQTYGLPVMEREAPPARVMEFGIGDCRLAAYLYFDTARNDFYTLQYEVNGMTVPSPATDRCLIRISRDASRR